jgi:hypothetical protein
MIKEILFILVAILMSLAATPGPTHAQGTQPKLMVTWRSSNYAPLDFKGRVLPIKGSFLEAGVEVLDRGIPADLSLQKIYWYLNGNLIAGGDDIRIVRFVAEQVGALDLRVQIPNYKTQTLVKTITIPVGAPEAVIVASSIDGKISKRSTEMRAVPFFFNVVNPKNLNFSWRVNNQSPEGEENPDTLNVNIPKETPQDFKLNVELIIANPERITEVASEIVSFIVVP